MDLTFLCFIPCIEFHVDMVSTASLDWLQTLSDATRVRLLILLDCEELSVSELCSVVQLPQSTVSRHLKVLVENDWVLNRRDGTNHLYRVDRDRWEESRESLWDWVRHQTDTPTTMLDQQRLARVLSERSRSAAFFSSTAQQWDALRVELCGHQLDSFLLAAAMSPTAVIGELGCGSAPICQLIAPYVAEAYAIDNSAAMLATARERTSKYSNVKLVESNLASLPLRDAALDVAWMSLVLPYLNSPEEVFSEAARVIRTGAALIITDLLPHDRSGYQQEMGHLRLGTSREQLTGWLDAAGLQLANHVHLPPDPAAKGPALFVAVARKITAGFDL